jgi:hypothetical protein
VHKRIKNSNWVASGLQLQSPDDGEESFGLTDDQYNSAADIIEAEIYNDVDELTAIQKGIDSLGSVKGFDVEGFRKSILEELNPSPPVSSVKNEIADEKSSISEPHKEVLDLDKALNERVGRMNKTKTAKIKISRIILLNIVFALCIGVLAYFILDIISPSYTKSPSKKESPFNRKALVAGIFTALAIFILSPVKISPVKTSLHIIE